MRGEDIQNTNHVILVINMRENVVIANISLRDITNMIENE